MFLISRKTIEDAFCLRILKRLLSHGEDLTRTNILGQNVLMLAIAYQRSEDIITFLLGEFNVPIKVNEINIPKEEIHFGDIDGGGNKIEISNQINYENNNLPILKFQKKKINLSQKDVFGRTAFHYRHNPALRCDNHLFLGSSLSSSNTSLNISQSSLSSSNTSSKCDVFSPPQKLNLLHNSLKNSEDFNLHFPGVFTPLHSPLSLSSSNTNFQSSSSSALLSSTASIPSVHGEMQQGVRWYDLCSSLYFGHSSVYDDEEREIRSNEFEYLTETYGVHALTTLITIARGQEGLIGVEMV
jgi:hypothetical protein